MRIFHTRQGILANESEGGTFHEVDALDWDELVCSASLRSRVRAALTSPAVDPPAVTDLLPPIGTQEVWAAGVTYYRSRSARMEESKNSGGGTFYDRVYAAERPELFFKATARRVIGPGGAVRIRSDAKWSVPEPELTLMIDARGHITGYTIGNDMSSRDIEGENPLYLPQAKVYDGACALGPCVMLAEEPLPHETTITIAIMRGGGEAFAGTTTLAAMKREPEELARFLYRDNSFPAGTFLMTGTGIVPGDAFTLASGDHIAITIDGIGTLTNYVA